VVVGAAVVAAAAAEPDASSVIAGIAPAGARSEGAARASSPDVDEILTAR
jgi:hypothetical protein